MEMPRGREARSFEVKKVEHGGVRQLTVEEAVMEYGDMLFRISMVLLGHEQDAQDVVQDTFCRYMEHRQALYDKDHEKAWLIRVAVNRCKDVHRGRRRHPLVCLEEVEQYCEFQEQSEVLTALMNLPDQMKTVLYLHYIEGYKSAEIARMLGITTSAVKKRMQRGREQMKLSLSGKEPLSS